MTITGMGELFDLMQDKYGSPYYTNSEKSLFLNRAIVDFVLSKLPGSERGQDNVEHDQDDLTEVAPLIKSINSLKMDSTGSILKSSVAANTSPYIPWRLLNIGWSFGNSVKPVKFVRHNDWYQFKDNYFKAPSSDNPKYREFSDKYLFEPINVNATLYITVLNYPTVVDIDTNVSCDLPDYTHNRIVALALEYAGIGSRDENLAQLLQLKTNK